jgi:hypothetical protein
MGWEKRLLHGSENLFSKCWGDWSLVLKALRAPWGTRAGPTPNPQVSAGPRSRGGTGSAGACIGIPPGKRSGSQHDLTSVPVNLGTGGGPRTWGLSEVAILACWNKLGSFKNCQRCWWNWSGLGPGHWGFVKLSRSFQYEAKVENHWHTCRCSMLHYKLPRERLFYGWGEWLRTHLDYHGYQNP